MSKLLPNSVLALAQIKEGTNEQSYLWTVSAGHRGKIEEFFGAL